MSVCKSVTLIDSDTLKHPFGGPSRFFFYLFPVPILSQLIVTIIFCDSLILNGSDILTSTPDDLSIIMHLGQARVHSHNDTMHSQHPCRAPYCSMLHSRLMQLSRPCHDQDFCLINQETIQVFQGFVVVISVASSQSQT